MKDLFSISEVLSGCRTLVVKDSQDTCKADSARKVGLVPLVRWAGEELQALALEENR